MSKANDMSFQLFALAAEIAEESYGCDLDRLDPEELDWYAQRVNDENLQDMANDLAAAAWQAY